MTDSTRLLKTKSYQKKIQNTKESIQKIEDKLNSSVKKYKSRKSENNQKAWRRCNNIPVAENKKDNRTFLCTKDFNSLKDVYINNPQYKYVAAGKNSIERENLIVDIDNPDVSIDYILDMSQKVIRKNPSYIKVNPENNHKQVGFFFDECIYTKYTHLDSKGFLITKKNDEEHKEYMFLIRAYNYVFSGDLNYQGYICQNPYNDINNTFFYEKEPFDPNYLLTSVRRFLVKESGAKTIEDKREVLKLINDGFLWNSLRHKTSKKEINVSNTIYLDEENKKKFSLESRLSEYENKLKSLNNNDNEKYNNSYDKKYFVTSTQVLKRNYLRILKNSYDEDIKVSLKKFIYKMADEVKLNMEITCPEGTGYTEDEEDSRIYYDLNQLIDSIDEIEWDKTGFTAVSRLYSQNVRNHNKQIKMMNMAKEYSFLTDSQTSLSIRDKAKIIYERMDNVSYNTVKTFIHSYQNLLKKTGMNRHSLNFIFSVVDNFKYFSYSFFKVNGLKVLKDKVSSTMNSISKVSVSDTLTRLYKNSNLKLTISFITVKFTDSLFSIFYEKLENRFLSLLSNNKINRIQGYYGLCNENEGYNEHIPSTKSLPEIALCA